MTEREELVRRASEMLPMLADRAVGERLCQRASREWQSAGEIAEDDVSEDRRHDIPPLPTALAS